MNIGDWRIGGRAQKNEQTKIKAVALGLMSGHKSDSGMAPACRVNVAETWRGFMDHDARAHRREMNVGEVHRNYALPASPVNAAAGTTSISTASASAAT